MMVCFRNLDVLQLALTTGAVPPDVALKPAIAGFGEEEQVWIETTAKLSAAAQRELKRLGAVIAKSSDIALSTEVACWLELLSLVREDLPLGALEKTSVLFDVPSAEELSRLVLEMLRLGNDRQSYRWLEETDGPAESPRRPDDGRALLRVVGPPYYSLLRAIDQLGGAEIAPHALVERAPGVWVQVGYRHPLAEQIKPPKDHILLLRPPRHWLMLPDASFRDIYEIVEFELPNDASLWADTPVRHRLRVTPRLRQAGPSDSAELWVLRGDAVNELNRFVQNAEDQLLNRLAFAVGEKNGQTIVVLRVRQSKQPPPVLVLPAEAYKSYLKLPNLFLPSGYSLHPPLRRDVVRKLFAEDLSQITWLVPEDTGQFALEGLPDDVFRPLTDWVDYVLDRDREPLQAWVQAMQFEFEPFICDDEQPSKPEKPPAAEKTRRPKRVSAPPAAKAKPDEAKPVEQTTETAAEEVFLEEFSAVAKIEPSEIERELHAVEEEFLALPGGLDDEARRALWPRLADLNARLLKWEDAGLCWMNALWDGSDGKWIAAWFRTEAHSAPASSLSALHSAKTGGNPAEDDLDRLLALPEPSTADLRALAAYLAWSARQGTWPAALMQRLPALQRFLEQHEKRLPVRACWLAWYYLAHLTDGDVLALARARDRVLERLFHNGLRPEQDLPSFLRFAGRASDRRGTGLGPWMVKMHDATRRWVDRQRGQNVLDYKEAKTKEYIDLLFAFGLALLGEHDASRQLLHNAQRVLQKEDEAHVVLLRLFEYRIRQAMEGQSTHAPLESEALERLNELRRVEQERRAATKGNSGSHRDTGTHLSYVIDKMRGTSRILEPLQKIQEYRYTAALTGGEVEQTLARLPDIKDRKELNEQIKRLLNKGTTSLCLYVPILTSALEQSPRVGEEIAQHLLEQALRIYDTTLKLGAETKDRPAPEALMELLERGLFVAAHFDRQDVVQALMARFRQLLREEREWSTIAGFDRVVEQCLRGLRKLGLRGEKEELLKLMSAAVLKGHVPMALLAQKDAGQLLRTVLPIAAGWYDFGRDSLAEPIFQAARTLLLRKELVPTEHLALACAYAKALAAAPSAIVQERVEELLEKLEGIPNTSSFGNYYSPAQIRFVESVVLAVVSDDFTQGSQARRWLDEDEYLVRQRIHGDVRNLLART